MTGSLQTNAREVEALLRDNEATHILPGDGTKLLAEDVRKFYIGVGRALGFQLDTAHVQFKSDQLLSRKEWMFNFIEYFLEDSPDQDDYLLIEREERGEEAPYRLFRYKSSNSWRPGLSGIH